MVLRWKTVCHENPSWWFVTNRSLVSLLFIFYFLLFITHVIIVTTLFTCLTDLTIIMKFNRIQVTSRLKIWKKSKYFIDNHIFIVSLNDSASNIINMSLFMNENIHNTWRKLNNQSGARKEIIFIHEYIFKRRVWFINIELWIIW